MNQLRTKRVLMDCFLAGSPGLAELDYAAPEFFGFIKSCAS